ncbi:MAG TPA: formyltetrahydrofolate deformylase [Acidimicrobiales bacterium]|nr:formyltetrahydrofolate deformylase [Acidimicrobiales bacterium]
MSAGAPADRIVLRFSCPDRVGIVHAVAGFLASRDLNIVESQQFAEPSSGRFFMRVEASARRALDLRALRGEFAPLAQELAMAWDLLDAERRPRLLVLVSRLGHCLNDLLYRWRTGSLRADIVAVVSNHADFEGLARSSGVPFFHLPVSPHGRAEQEARLLELVDEYDVELVVLARYMQILSAPTAERLAGRAINIHHSFLPSFTGARPYHQAYERGVKLVGATAHYLTAALDEGPIIEQEVVRVDHSHSPERLAELGRDVECVVLARAVAWHLDQRVMLNGDKTVVFR